MKFSIERMTIYIFFVKKLFSVIKLLSFSARNLTDQYKRDDFCVENENFICRIYISRKKDGVN